jgi:hypothetical protein
VAQLPREALLVFLVSDLCHKVSRPLKAAAHLNSEVLPHFFYTGWAEAMRCMGRMRRNAPQGTGPVHPGLLQAAGRALLRFVRRANTAIDSMRVRATCIAADSHQGCLPFAHTREDNLVIIRVHHVYMPLEKALEARDDERYQPEVR